jgi:chorismate synthase
MLALVLIDHALRHRAQNADVKVLTPKIAAQAPARAKTSGELEHKENPEPDEA